MINKKMISIIAIIAMILICFAYMAHISGEEYTANQYFKALASKDWEKAYKYLYFEETDFVNKDTIIKYLQSENNRYSTMDIDSFKVSSNLYEIKDSPLGDIYVEQTGYPFYALYQEKGSDKQETDGLTAVPTGKRKFLFFKEYKIKMDFAVIEQCLEIPSMAKISVDGIELTEQYVSEISRDRLVSYVIPEAMHGEHEIKVYGDDIVPYETVEEFDTHTVIDFKNLRMTDEAQETLVKRSAQDIKEYMLGRVENKPVDSLNLKLAENDKAELEEGYKEWQKSYSYIHYTSYEVETNGDVAYYGSSRVLTGQINCCGTWNTKESYIMDSGYQADDKTNHGSYNIVYSYENGEYVISRISIR